MIASKLKTEFYTYLKIAFICSLLFFLLTVNDKNIQSYLVTLSISLMYTFGFGMANSMLNSFLDQKYSWVAQTSQRAIAGIVGTLVLNILMTYGMNYLNFVLLQGMSSEEFFSSQMNFTNWFFINLALLISAFLHARSFMLAMKQNARQEVIEQKLIASSANAQFESLKNQLDPHFLFNSLNVLSSIIDENPEQAQRFTASMSKVYRYVLDQKDKELVTVEEELDFAKTYSELLKTRFEDSVSFDFQVSQETRKKYVVPLSLQLILENAIKHNYATSQNPLNIKIYEENKHLVIENNLQVREMVKERDGIGLSNIVQRYSLFTKQNVLIEKSNEYFKIKIPVVSEKVQIMNKDYYTDSELTAYEKAERRVHELKGFYGNLIAYCIVIPCLFFINWKTVPEYWWAFWPMLGWGIGLASHAFKVFGFGQNWEEKQIQKILDKERKTKS